MDGKSLLKTFLILFYIGLSTLGIGELAIEFSASIFGLDLSKVAFIYVLVVLVSLNSIQAARVIEDLARGEEPSFLLTYFFRLEDIPKRDVTRDPIAFLGLLCLLLGGYLIRPLSAFLGLYRFFSSRPPSEERIEAIKTLVFSYFLLIGLLATIAFALIESRYASRGSVFVLGSLL